MSYGIIIKRDNGELAITSEMPGYSYYGALITTTQEGSAAGDTQALIDCTDRSSPPLLFTRPYGATENQIGFIPFFPIWNNGSGYWEVSNGFFPRSILPDDIGTPIPEGYQFKTYIFTTKGDRLLSGYGIKIGDGENYWTTGGLTDSPPLVIKRSIYLDENTTDKALTPYPNNTYYGRTVALPDNGIVWAAGASYYLPALTSWADLFGSFSRVLKDTAGYFVAAIPTNIKLSNIGAPSITTAHGNWEGPIDGRDIQREHILKIWCINASMYD